MATGKYVSDLEAGDRLGPISYEVSAFTVREYCHSVELDHEMFLGIETPVAPPTLVHLDKLKLYEAACPMGTGPAARVHIEFDATYHAAVPIGTHVDVVGVATDRFEKRGRTYVTTDIKMTEARTGRALVDYRDTVILSYTGKSGTGATQ